MGAPDEPPGAGGVPPPAAFFGLWPRIAEPEPVATPRLVALSADQPDLSAGERVAAARLA
ncbi:MAG TPA: hypothetical protein VFJ82_07705 [Longimicrobium sp.]|nr:hypothetical protein [Longimicrobium sp.]